MKYFLSVVSYWIEDYGDYKAIVDLFDIEKQRPFNQLGSFIVSYSLDEIKQASLNYSEDISEGEIVNALTTLASKDLQSIYLKLPSISKCSKLLSSIYEAVCESEVSMCHIDYQEWNDIYLNDGYSEKDIEILKEEIEKYDLEEVLECDVREYKIVAYSDLDTRFFDDSKIINNSEYELADMINEDSNNLYYIN